MSDLPYAVKFFLDEPPLDFDLASLERAGRKPFMAHINRYPAVGGLYSDYERGVIPEMPKYVFKSYIEVQEILAGGRPEYSAPQFSGLWVLFQRFDILREKRAQRLKIIIPLFRREKAGKFVVSLLDDEDVRILQPFSASREEWDAHYQQILDSDRM